MQHHLFFPWFPGALGTILLFCCIIPYFLPTIIAFARKKDNAGGVFALNFFLGWTFIGWIASLIWALSSPGPSYPPESYQSEPYRSDYQPAGRQTNPTIRPKS